MIDENMFICCEIDEEEDYYIEFKEIVDNIIKYLESIIKVTFKESEYALQAVDVYDCNIIRCCAAIDDSNTKLVVAVPIDQFEIYIEASEKKRILASYCYIDIPQYSQENLDKMRAVLLDFEEKYKNFIDSK